MIPEQIILVNRGITVYILFETEEMDGVVSTVGKIRFWKEPDGGF